MSTTDRLSLAESGSHPLIFKAGVMAAAFIFAGLLSLAPNLFANPETSEQGRICNSPSAANPASNGQPPCESKVSSLTSEGRAHIKLDFIPSDERAKRASRGFPCVSSPEGVYGIEGHGSPHSVFSREGEPMNASELAEWIRNDTRYQAGMTVYLFCCETGKGDRSFAQRLANTLGANVVAPTEKFWPQPNGLYLVARERTHKTLGIFETGEQRADTTRPGTMKTFKPSAEAVAAAQIPATSKDDDASLTDSSSSAASMVRTQQPPRKPFLRASARTAALLAGIQGPRDSTAYFNSRR
jgi:hypothetical protein